VCLLLPRLHRARPMDAGACALVISNATRTVAVWRQASGRPDAAVVWDYHVVAAAVDAAGDAWVWDADTTLPWPCSLPAYLAGAFGYGGGTDVPARLSPRFRVVAADAYVAHFSSDRSHMRANGGWLAPPPRYAPLRGAASESAHELPRLWDVRALGRAADDGEAAAWLGDVVALDDLESAVARCCGRPLRD